MIQLCQSERSGGAAPCSLSAAVRLFGVHLCTLHERQWRAALTAGRKIRIHPLRALPLEHDCSNEPTRRCSKCRQDKPLSQFSPHGTTLNWWCRPCCAEYQRKYTKKSRAATDAPSQPAPSGTASPPTAMVAAHRGPYEYLIELVCSMCGRAMGNVAVDHPRAPLPVLPTRRCTACGGALMQSGDVSRRFVGIDPFTDEDKPRRGRPTKAVVAARRGREAA